MYIECETALYPEPRHRMSYTTSLLRSILVPSPLGRREVASLTECNLLGKFKPMKNRHFDNQDTLKRSGIPAHKHTVLINDPSTPSSVSLALQASVVMEL